MVQIMSDSGPSCRTRAERASLDGKPEYPTATQKRKRSNLQTPVVNPQRTTKLFSSTGEAEEESEYEDYRVPRKDSEKDSGIGSDPCAIHDPWAATSSFVSPPSFEDPDADATPSFIDDTISDPDFKIGRNFKVKRLRRISGSHASTKSSCKSKKSLEQSSTGKTILSSRGMEENDFLQEQKLQPEMDGDESEKLESVSNHSTTTPYCYRCYLKFKSYSAWKTHAVYEHILTKNPLPIVEMNYIDPNTLKKLPEEKEVKAADSVDMGVKDEVQNHPGTSESQLEQSSDVPPEGEVEEAGLPSLKLCIGKDKGGYVVVKRKKSSCSSIPALDDTPPIITLEEITQLSTKAATSSSSSAPITKPPPPLLCLEEIENAAGCSSDPRPMPTLTPCPALKEKKGAEMENGGLDLPARGRRLISNESESDVILNENTGEFEKALDFAVEMSIRDGDRVVYPSPNAEDLQHKAQLKTISEEKDNSIHEIKEGTNEKIPQEKIPDLVKSFEMNEDGSEHEIEMEVSKEVEEVSDSVMPPENGGTHAHAKSLKSRENEEPENGAESIAEGASKDGEEDWNSSSGGLGKLKAALEKGNLALESINKEMELSSNKTSSRGEEDNDCQICHKVFSSCEDLEQHFSDEHFRVGNTSIMEPESPYPQTPKQSEPPSRNVQEKEDVPPPLPLPDPTHQQQQPVPQLLQQTNPAYPNGAPVNLLRRRSNDNLGVIHPGAGTAQEELQNLMWRNHNINASVYGNRMIGNGNPPPPYQMHITSNNRPLLPNGQRTISPNGGIQMRGPSNHQVMHPRQIQQHQQQVQRHPQQQQYSLGGPQAGLDVGTHQRGLGAALQMQHRMPPSSTFPSSLHSMLVGTPAANVGGGGGVGGGGRGGGMNQNQHQRFGSNASLGRPPLMRVSSPYQMQSRGPHVPGSMSLQSAMTPQHQQHQQHLLQQINAQQRELNSQFQQRNNIAPRLGPLSDQSRMVNSAAGRPGPLSQKRAAAAYSGGLEISAVRSTKEPRLEVGGSNRVGTVGPPHPELGKSPLNSGGNPAVAAAIGSVGAPGVNSVRLGTSITLSVCPTASAQNPDPSNPPFRHPSPSGAVSSVLAVRGVTVTPASPPATSPHCARPSPGSSPSSTVPAASVIQRGPTRSISPGENHRDRNFSPPVITTVRGAVPIAPSSQQHNFAVPRVPGNTPPRQGVTINPAADRPDRPPTVDLTDDDVSLARQMQQNQGRRVVAPVKGQRPHCCEFCGMIFPSIQSLEVHKLSSHQLSRVVNGAAGSGCSPNNQVTITQTPIPRYQQQQQQQNQSQLLQPQPTAVRSILPNSNRQLANVNAVAPVRTPPLPPSLVRQQTQQQQTLHQQGNNSASFQYRSHSPNRPSAQSTNSQGMKNLFIPLLDLNRMDAAKLRKLEELGISCVVPLQDNSSMSNMGIPVMNLRNEGLSGGNHHLPWDSILPMGPALQPMIEHRPHNSSQSSGPVASNVPRYH